MLCFADRTEVIFGLETGAVSIYCHECYERGQGGKRGCKAQTEDGCVQSVMEAAATTAESSGGRRRPGPDGGLSALALHYGRGPMYTLLTTEVD